MTIANPAERYQGKLKSIVREILTENFVAKTWIRKNGMQSNFIEACVIIGIIKPVSVIGRRIVYQTNYKPEEITLEHGASVIQTLRQINKAVAVRKKTTPKPVESGHTVTTEVIYRPTPIPDFADMDEDHQDKLVSQIPVMRIIIELRKRGYEGTVSRMEEYVIA